MQKIIMPTEETKNFLEVFEMFVISQSAKGVGSLLPSKHILHFLLRLLCIMPQAHFSRYTIVIFPSSLG